MRDGVAPVVHEVKTDGPALKIHAGFTGHSALQLLVWQVVAPAVLDEHGAGLDKAEGHVGIHAFLPEGLDPIEIAGAGTIVVFAAADDLLDLPGGKVLPDAYRPDEGRAHDAPRLNPPRVGFFQEEIRGHADPDLLTTLDFVVSGSVFLERVGKAAFRFVDLGSILVPHPVEKIHVTVLAALAALDAAVPWIPDVVQEAHLLSVPIIIAARTGNKSTPCAVPSDVIRLNKI